VTNANSPSLSIQIPTTVAEIRHQYILDDYSGNLLVGIDWGIAGDQPIARSLTWTLPSGDTTGWNYRLTDVRTFYQNLGSSSLSPVGPVREYTYSYDSHGRLTATGGVLSGGLPLPGPDGTSASRAAPQLPPLSGPVSFVSLICYDPFGNVQTVQEPPTNGMAGGRCTKITYDGMFSQLPTTTAVYLSTCVDSTPPMQTVRTYDRGSERVVAQTLPYRADVASTWSIMKYDAFGRVVEVDQPDPYSLAMTTPAAALLVDYQDGAPVRQVHIQTVDGVYQAPNHVDHYRYLDAFGDTLAGLDRSGPTGLPPAATKQWTVSGVHTRYATGWTQTASQPFFFSGEASTFHPDTYAYNSPARSFQYDGLGRILSSTDFYGRATTFTQNPFSVTVQDPEQASGGLHAGASTSSFWDGHGRVLLTQRHLVDGAASDVRTGTAYQATGEPVSITQSSGGQSVTRWMQYDTLGRMVFNAEPNTSTNFSPTVNASGVRGWTYAYDIGGRLVGTSDARGCGENIFHDNYGRVIAEDYSPCGDPSQPTYSANPNLATGDNTEAFYQYDVRGRLLDVKDRAQHSAYLYDYRNNVTSVSRQIAIPGDTPLVGFRYASNVYAKYITYTEAHRPQQTSVAGISLVNTSILSAGYTYDGLIQGISSPSAGNAPTGSTVYLASQTFDPSGRPTQQVFGDAAATTAVMSYDHNEHLSEYDVSRSAGSWQTGAGYTFEANLTKLTFTYDAVGNPATSTDAADAGSLGWPTGSAPASRTIKYYSDYRLKDVATSYTGGYNAYVSPYQAEAANGKHTYPQPNPAVTTRSVDQSFVYDYLGNMTAHGEINPNSVEDFYDRSIPSASHGTSTNGPNRITTATGTGSPAGAISAYHDFAGNMQSLTVTRPGTTPATTRYNYGWDEVGRLASARRSEVTSNGVTSYYINDAFTYTANGQRISTAKQDSTVVPQTTTYTVQVFDSLVLKDATFALNYQDDLTTENLYLGIGGTTVGHAFYDATLPSSGPNGAVHVFMQIGDALGSTSFVIDHDTGELVEHPSYQPYGAADTDFRDASRWKSGRTNAPFREDVRYTGHQDDAEVGLIYFGARYYNPELGQWISPDPLTIHGLGADLNPYAFVRGSPLGNVDPIGLCDDKGKEQQCQKSGGGIFEVLGIAGLFATLGVASAVFYVGVAAATTAAAVGIGVAAGAVGLALSPGVLVNGAIGYGAYEGVKAFGGLLPRAPALRRPDRSQGLRVLRAVT
jgi:RHS repeat-associated protein